MNAIDMRQLRDRRLIEGVLASGPLFRGMGPAQLAALGAKCWTLAAHAGEPVVARGTRVAGIFAVAYGTVKLALRSPSGGERVWRLVQAGQTFAEPSALLGRPAPFDALALTECKLVVIPVAAVSALLEREPSVARETALALAERVIGLLGELEATSMLSTRQRLARYLIGIAGAEAQARLPASKTVIAARLGMKKETFSRLLRALAQRGVIGVQRREIAILDRERLAELARERISSGRASGA